MANSARLSSRCEVRLHRAGSVIKGLPTLTALKRELAQAGDQRIARNPIWFKTGKGQYGHGDQFIGVRIPILRTISRKYHHLKLPEIAKLLRSRIHEYRYAALLILVSQYEDGDSDARQKVFDFYLKHTRYVNNWDLVDTSAPNIVGEHLVHRSRRVLYRLAESPILWERRIAMVATWAFIQRGDLEDTFGIANRLLADKHDLIHKAMGWMLREAGVYSRPRMIAFLKRHYLRMPRTALRYAIEHLPGVRRKKALSGIFV
jgi:3-methyladenine DNA glycosylase AlkD